MCTEVQCNFSCLSLSLLMPSSSSSSSAMPGHCEVQTAAQAAVRSDAILASHLKEREGEGGRNIAEADTGDLLEGTYMQTM